MKREQLKKSHLYVIIDRGVLNPVRNTRRLQMDKISNEVKKRDLAQLTKSVIKGGADIIQLRDKISNDSEFLKEADQLRDITKEKGILFIVNDRADIAKTVSADGLHLGREDLPINFARKILGKNSIIGLSCHSLKDVSKAKKQNADYISIGPIFKTPLKTETKPINLYSFKNLEKRINIPVFAIGGINYRNLRKILKMGIKRVAICRGIFLRKKISEETKKIKRILLNTD